MPASLSMLSSAIFSTQKPLLLTYTSACTSSTSQLRAMMTSARSQAPGQLQPRLNWLGGQKTLTQEVKSVNVQASVRVSVENKPKARR